jgi:hypothetical protein
MNLAQEIRQVANQLQIGRPDLANRLLHIASRVARLELRLDEITADAAIAERIRYEGTAGPGRPHREAMVLPFPHRPA